MVDESQPTSRRERERVRRTRRKQRRVNTAGWLATLAVVVLLVLLSTDTLRVGARGPKLAGDKTNLSTGTSSTTDAVAKLKNHTPPRALSNSAPLRLWVGGDSIAGDLGYQLGPMLEQTGVVKAHVDYKVSSGLASDAVRDWPQRFTQERVQYRPEAIVFMVGANDAPIVGSATDASGQPTWEAKYRSQVDTMMDLLVGGAAKRTVFWIGSPTLGTKYDHGASEVDRVMREEAAKRPSIVYVDAYALFSANGEYSATLPDATGERVRMRTGDGVHLTVAGAKFLAQKVYSLIDSVWELSSQTSPSTPIDYTIEPKSGTIGGVHLSGGHHTTNPTSPPVATAAPTTTHAPVTTAAPTTTKPKQTQPPTSTTGTPTNGGHGTTPTTGHGT
jgi:hypothetical protein